MGLFADFQFPGFGIEQRNLHLFFRNHHPIQLHAERQDDVFTVTLYDFVGTLSLADTQLADLEIAAYRAAAPANSQSRQKKQHREHLHDHDIRKRPVFNRTIPSDSHRLIVV